MKLLATFDETKWAKDRYIKSISYILMETFARSVPSKVIFQKLLTEGFRQKAFDELTKTARQKFPIDIITNLLPEKTFDGKKPGKRSTYKHYPPKGET
jgi:hypothetical protein